MYALDDQMYALDDQMYALDDQMYALDDQMYALDDQMCALEVNGFNPTNAETTFVQSKRKQRNLRTIVLVFMGNLMLSNNQISAHVPGFQSFLRFLYHFITAKLATNSIIRVIEDI